MTPVRSSNTVIRGFQEALSYVGLQPPNENDLVKRASLLMRDSVHGSFAGSVTVDEDAEYEDGLFADEVRIDGETRVEDSNAGAADLPDLPEDGTSDGDTRA